MNKFDKNKIDVSGCEFNLIELPGDRPICCAYSDHVKSRYCDNFDNCLYKQLHEAKLDFEDMRKQANDAIKRSNTQMKIIDILENALSYFDIKPCRCGYWYMRGWTCGKCGADASKALGEQ